jgi:hypothetical protein
MTIISILLYPAKSRPKRTASLSDQFNDVYVFGICSLGNRLHYNIVVKFALDSGPDSGSIFLALPLTRHMTLGKLILLSFSFLTYKVGIILIRILQHSC